MEKIQLSELNEKFKQPIDIFICFAGFEDRSLSIPTALKDKIKSTVIFTFDKNAANCTLDKRNEINGIFKEKQIKSEILNLSWEKPIQMVDEIIKSLTGNFDLKKNQHKSILIDFSTFSREVLLIFFKWLYDSKLYQKHQFQLIYNSAVEYSLNENEENNKWLTRGIGEIRSVLGFPGLFNPIQKLHLIVMIGFEFERAVKFIEAYEPSYISLGLGGIDCSINSNLQKINKKKHQMVKDWYGNVEEFCFSLIDPIQTKEDLKKQIDKFQGYNVIIAPLNTKISTLGAALLAIERPEVQICYAEANIYNTEGYSKPGEDCYLFDFSELIDK